MIGVREALLAAAAIGIACNVSALLSRSVRELRRLDDEAAAPAAPSVSEVVPEPAPTVPVA